MTHPAAQPKAETRTHPEAPLKFAGDPLAELAFAAQATAEDREAARAWARVSALREALRDTNEQLLIERRRCAALERELERRGDRIPPRETT